MSFWGGVKSFILDLMDEKPLEKRDKVPFALVESRFYQLIQIIKAQSPTLPNRDELKQAIEILSNLMCVLEKSKFQYTHTEQFQEVRGIFLELWNNLLKFTNLFLLSLKNRKQADNGSFVDLRSILTFPDIEVFHKAINYLMIRKEFDLKYLGVDKTTGELNCSQLDGHLAHKYRKLLCFTQEYAQNLLNFYVKFFCFLFFSFWGQNWNFLFSSQI